MAKVVLSFARVDCQLLPSLPFTFTAWIIVILIIHLAVGVFYGSYLDQCLSLILILVFCSPRVS